jgi:hypothetical protein
MPNRADGSAKKDGDLRAATVRARRIRRRLNRLTRQLDTLEKRLIVLDRYYRHPRFAVGPKSRHYGIRGQGPTVQEAALHVLQQAGTSLNIFVLAARVQKLKLGRAGEYFTQNLRAALNRDPRFLRVQTGLYALRES